MANWYVSSVRYTAVAQWTASTAYTVGQIVRQLATPTQGNERCFRCSVAGTSGGTEPTWGLTKNSTTSDNGITWVECTGAAAYNGDGGGTAWGAPAPRLEIIMNATTPWQGAGDTVFVGHDHSETRSSGSTMSFGWNSSVSLPVRALCVTDNGTVPPTALATTAQITTTVAGITFASTSMHGICYGIKFYINNAGSADITLAGAAGSAWGRDFTWESCEFRLGTSAAGKIVLGASISFSGSVFPVKTAFRNCSFIFGNTAQRIAPSHGDITIEGGSVALTGTVPGAVFRQAGISYSVYGNLKVRGVDFSTINTYLVEVGTGPGLLTAEFSNCKLNASTSLILGTRLSRSQEDVRAFNCSDGTDGNYMSATDYAGVLLTDTSKYRTGSTIAGGTVACSHVASTTANASLTNPFKAYEEYISNVTTGSSKTLTVEFCGATALYNDEIWLDVEYYGDASSMKSTIGTTRVLLGTRSLHPTSSVSWVGSPATKQYISFTFTPQKSGYVRATVYVGKPSATVYIDPIFSLS